MSRASALRHRQSVGGAERAFVRRCSLIATRALIVAAAGWATAVGASIDTLPRRDATTMTAGVAIMLTARLAITNPDATDAALRRLSGNDTNAAKWSYRERRKELLLALARQHADDFDTAVEELGRTFDHLRQVGFRGFLAETTNDRDLGRATPAKTDPSPPTDTASTAEAHAAETRLGTRRSDDGRSPGRAEPLANTRRRKAGGGRRTQEK